MKKKNSNNKKKKLLFISIESERRRRRRRRNIMLGNKNTKYIPLCALFITIRLLNKRLLK